MRSASPGKKRVVVVCAFHPYRSVEASEVVCVVCVYIKKPNHEGSSSVSDRPTDRPTRSARARFRSFVRACVRACVRWILWCVSTTRVVVIRQTEWDSDPDPDPDPDLEPGRGGEGRGDRRAPEESDGRTDGTGPAQTVERTRKGRPRTKDDGRRRDFGTEIDVVDCCASRVGRSVGRCGNMVDDETTTTTKLTTAATTTMMMMMSPPKARYKLEARRRRMETTTKSSASDASDGTVTGVDEGTRAGANSRRANDRAADRSGRERESSAAASARR